MSGGADLWSNVISAGAGLLGAGVGGWVTWRASERAANRSAEATRAATAESAAAALWLSRLERLDPFVDELAQAAWGVRTAALANRAARVDHIVDVSESVVSRAHRISPHLAETVEFMNGAMEAAWQEAMEQRTHDARGSWQWSTATLHEVSYVARALHAACLSWMQDPEGYEKRKTPAIEVLEAAKRISDSDLDSLRDAT